MFCVVVSVFYCCMGLLGGSSLSLMKKLPALKDSMILVSRYGSDVSFNVKSKGVVTLNVVGRIFVGETHSFQ